jgi:hypothetical protein
MKTAVEWLIHQLITENEVSIKGENYKLFDIAKEMEKNQIIEAHGNKKRNSSGVTNYEYTYTGEDYYNEKFNGVKIRK